MAVSVKEVLVEVYNAIGKVKRYYALLRRSYEILRKELAE